MLNRRKHINESPSSYSYKEDDRRLTDDDLRADQVKRVRKEMGLDNEVKKDLKQIHPAYVVECTYSDAEIIKHLSYDFTYKRLKSGSIAIFCKDWKGVESALYTLNKYKAFEREALNGKEYGAAKIYKYRSSMNDSVNEAAVNTPEEGVFVTDFTYSPDPLGDTLTEDQAAELHIKWLRKKGLQVEVEKKRYSTQFTIYYNGAQQYKDLMQWVAWDMGFSETISNGCPAGDREEVAEIIASGKNCIF